MLLVIMFYAYTESPSQGLGRQFGGYIVSWYDDSSDPRRPRSKPAGLGLAHP